jgi:hypothetical protein
MLSVAAPIYISFVYLPNLSTAGDLDLFLGVELPLLGFGFEIFRVAELESML